MEVTAYDLAKRFIGLSEISGPLSNPGIVTMLQLDNKAVHSEDTPWCSAFVNYICWLLKLERSKSLSARSWLKVGREVVYNPAISNDQAIDPLIIGYDVVILKRGGGNQPGADVLQAPGHVGFFGGITDLRSRVYVLGGNQGNSVSLQSFPMDQVLGYRRLGYDPHA